MNRPVLAELWFPHLVVQRLGLYLHLARPHQYLKNGFIWLPLFFGHKLGDLQAVWQTFWGFLAFCLAASSVYVLNDLKDVAEDRRHPVKRLRPLASGALNPTEAILFLILLLIASGTIAVLLCNYQFCFILLAYIVLNLAYSSFLKHLAIVDVVCIASGFVFRVLAGGVLAAVPISHWIITLTFLLALFLSLAKRRDDLLLAAQGRQTRTCIHGYNLIFVSASMAVMASVIVVAYLLYTVSPETITRHGTDQLYLTAFWVIVGLLRYLQLTFVEARTGSPTRVLLTDGFLQVVMFAWMVSFFLLLYGVPL